jgi:hypothetical protein
MLVETYYGNQQKSKHTYQEKLVFTRGFQTIKVET